MLMVRLIKHNNCLAQMPTDQGNEQQTLEPGRYEYQFEFKLPCGIPNTYQVSGDDNARVRAMYRMHLDMTTIMIVVVVVRRRIMMMRRRIMMKESGQKKCEI
jgi:hypothetical protein